MENETKNIQDELDNTIIALCECIQDEIKKPTKMDGKWLPEMINAQAELITAWAVAKSSYPQIFQK